PSATPTSSDADLYKYEMLVSRLTELRKNGALLLAKYTPENQQGQRNRAQLNEVERKKTDLEKKFPDCPSRLTASLPEQPHGLDRGTERGRLAGIQARVATLQKQLTEIRKRMEQFSQVGPQIDQLERQKDLEENNYKYFEGTLEKARVDEALDPSKIPN